MITSQGRKPDSSAAAVNSTSPGSKLDITAAPSTGPKLDATAGGTANSFSPEHKRGSTGASANDPAPDSAARPVRNSPSLAIATKGFEEGSKHEFEYAEATKKYVASIKARKAAEQVRIPSCLLT